MKLKLNRQTLKKQLSQLPRPQQPIFRIIMVDTENMGDIWSALLEKMTIWDKLVVFYTKNSTHMACESTIQFLKHRRRRIEWIPCVEGNNALDFQLITELGARISRDKRSEYIIVSKDKGYDAAVDYWAKRGRKIRRTGDIPALPSVRQKSKKKAYTYSTLPSAEKRMIDELCKAVYIEDKSLLFLALTHLKSPETGKVLYKAVKKDEAGTLPLRQKFLLEPEARVRQYLGLIYQDNKCDLERMLELYRYSKAVPAKDLYETMQKEFGHKEGRRLYQIMKANLSVLAHIEKQRIPAIVEQGSGADI